MKKHSRAIISLILCAALLFGISVTAEAGDDVLKITVAADTHFQSFSDLGEFPSSELPRSYSEGMLDSNLYFHTSTQGQMDYESYAIIKQLLNSFVTGGDEYLLIAGDLTCGKRQSHIEFAEMLREAEEKSGKEIFVICGNHDCANDNFDKYISIDEFKEIYADFGYNQALNCHSESGSYIADLSEEYRLIAIDSCIYGEDEGEINFSVMEWIVRQAETAKADGKKLIGMMHHSILPHFYVQTMIEDYYNIAEQLADIGINLVFTGHIHANDISSAKTKNGNTLYDVQTGSLITSPNAFRHIALSDKIEITTEYITNIDTNDLPDGYSREQIEKIENNFSEYAYGFFEAGMCRWLNKNIGSAYKVGKMLKIESDSDEYRELEALMKIVGNAINLPLYDDGSTPGVLDSIEEIAESAGYILPESKYERIYQVVAALMGNFFRGDGSGKNLDAEVDLIFDCVKAALAHCSVNLICDGVLNDLLSFLKIEIPKDNLISKTARLNYTQGVVNKLVNAIVTPLIQGISNDYSAPDDNEVIIDLSSLNTKLVNRAPLNVFEAVIRYFYSLFQTFLV